MDVIFERAFWTKIGGNIADNTPLEKCRKWRTSDR